MAKRSPVIKRINITPVDSFAGKTLASNAALTMPMPPIAVLDSPVKNPIRTSRAISEIDIVL